MNQTTEAKDKTDSAHPSEQLLCIRPTSLWLWGKRTFDGPKYNEIVTYAGKANHPLGILLKEYEHGNPSGWHMKWFVPLVSDDVLQNELRQIEIFQP